MLTVREVCALYMRHALAEGIHSAKARKGRESTFRRFCAVCGDLAVSEAKPFHLADWIESQLRMRSTSTRRAVSSHIRAAFAWAADGERIPRNPFQSVHYAEAERRPDLADTDQAALERLGSKSFELVLRWLRLTGCRLGELCGMTWGDVDLSAGVWTVHKHKTRKKTGRPKLIALVPEAVEFLLAVARARTPGHATIRVGATDASLRPVFVNTQGRPWKPDVLGQALRRLKARHGIDTVATLHGIRHRFATAAIANGGSPKLVGAHLGHSSVQTTERYYCDLGGQLEAVRAAAALSLR